MKPQTLTFRLAPYSALEHFASAAAHAAVEKGKRVEDIAIEVDEAGAAMVAPGVTCAVAVAMIRKRARTHIQ